LSLFYDSRIELFFELIYNSIFLLNLCLENDDLLGHFFILNDDISDVFWKFAHPRNLLYLFINGLSVHGWEAKIVTKFLSIFIY
jgi:hypothetical protein